VSKRPKKKPRAPTRARNQALVARQGATPPMRESTQGVSPNRGENGREVPTSQQPVDARVAIGELAVSGSVKAIKSLQEEDRPRGLAMILIAGVCAAVLFAAALTQPSVEMMIIAAAVAMVVIITLGRLAQIGKWSFRKPAHTDASAEVLSHVRLEGTVTLQNGAPAQNYTVTVQGYGASVNTSGVGYFALDVPRSVVRWERIRLSIGSVDGAWHPVEVSMNDLPWGIRLSGGADR
jgi:hypothetical protein